MLCSPAAFVGETTVERRQQGPQQLEWLRFPVQMLRRHTRDWKYLVAHTIGKPSTEGAGIVGTHPGNDVPHKDVGDVVEE